MSLCIERVGSRAHLCLCVLREVGGSAHLCLCVLRELVVVHIYVSVY